MAFAKTPFAVDRQAHVRLHVGLTQLREVIITQTGKEGHLAASPLPWIWARPLQLPPLLLMIVSSRAGGDELLCGLCDPPPARVPPY